MPELQFDFKKLAYAGLCDAMNSFNLSYLNVNFA